MIKIVLCRRCLLQNILSNMCVYIYIYIYIFTHMYIIIRSSEDDTYKIFILEEPLCRSLYKHMKFL